MSSSCFLLFITKLTMTSPSIRNCKTKAYQYNNSIQTHFLLIMDRIERSLSYYLIVKHYFLALAFTGFIGPHSRLSHIQYIRKPRLQWPQAHIFRTYIFTLFCQDISHSKQQSLSCILSLTEYKSICSIDS